MIPDQYKHFNKDVARFIPAERLITDPLRTLAYGTDASFYRLIPKVVITVQTEAEVQKILRLAKQHRVSVTFRAAGTSLSGQAITDSVLVRLGNDWRDHRIFDNAGKISLGPGVVGSTANRWLAEFGKKIGPDPASIDSAMIGGILANNASGMCCGVAENSYQTLHSLRVILQDGTLLDTADDKSRASFQRRHATLLKGLSSLREQVLADEALAERIRYKFKIKNTTGYSLNALLDFSDPFDILQHLLVGSEGTLGFVSEVVYRTVVEHRFKASSLILFPNINTACRAIPILRESQLAAAAELVDRAGLASVQSKPGLPDYLAGLGKDVTALLVETRAGSQRSLNRQISQISQALGKLKTVRPIEFTDVPDEYNALWKVRKGLFPAVGAVRKTGTTVIIEDVAFASQHLANAALDLQALFKEYGYDEAIIFGHALEGNLHFVFTQNFSIEEEVVRYRDFMDQVVKMVVEKYDGSLKAEHGTGRNMAPFVEKEWGEPAYALMKSIKQLFDPDGLLNPGVILNEDAETHIKNLKPLPASHEIIDKCIECGFCEPVCPSKNLSFTPRQRIISRREISRQMAAQEDPTRLKKFVHSYQYPGNDTCAADGLCATRCPVEIDTGKMTKQLRQEANGALSEQVASWVADHFALVSKSINTSLKGVDALHRLTGTRFLELLSRAARVTSLDALPLWNRQMPTGASKIEPQLIDPDNPLQVVYFPSCASRAMGGPARQDSQRQPLPQLTGSLLQKAGYQILYPVELDSLCCGQAFESKGFLELAERKSNQLSEALLNISDNGKLPVLCDTSPCLYRMKSTLDERLQLYEPIEFVLQFLLERLSFTPQNERVALHVTCSARKMGLAEKLEQLARLCATDLVIPEEIDCCGFAGDRGFNFPELNESALQGLQEQVCDCDAGYSTSKTCEIGLALHGEIPYRSILDLVDRATEPLKD